MMSILMSHLKAIKISIIIMQEGHNKKIDTNVWTSILPIHDGHQNPQNAHRKYFSPFLMTFMCDIKIYIIICEPHYVNLLFSCEPHP